MPKAKKTVVAPSVTAHPLICPFSNQPMEVRMVGDNVHFMVVSPHGFTSKLMKTREDCLEWCSHRAGVQTYTQPKIEVRHLETPDRSAEEGLLEIAPDPDSVNDEELPESLR